LHSSKFRRLTGAVITLLVIALVTLIGSTLARFPLTETESGSLVAEIAATDSTNGNPPATEAAEPLPSTPTPAPGSAESAVNQAAPPQGAEANQTEPAPEFGVTLQATPTRDEVAPVGEASADATSTIEAETAAGETPEAATPIPGESVTTGGLPLPNPDSPPTSTVQFFANANDIQDVAFADAAFWSATNAGAIQWDPDTGTSTLYGIEEGLGSVRLSSVVNCPLENFGLVFGSDAGLQVYNAAAAADGKAWRQITNSGASLRHRNISALACDPAQGILAVGYSEHGIDLYRERQGRWYYVERTEVMAPQGVSALAIGRGGVIWVASRGALASVNGTRITDLSSGNSPLTGEEITALAVDDTGALWVTAGDRLYRFADATWKVYGPDRVAGDFPRGQLADVQPAPGGRVWIASTAGSICRLDPELDTCSPFHSGAEGMAAGPVRDLATGPSGELGYGTALAGSSVLLRNRWRTLALADGFPSANRVFATTSDTNGFLWVATSTGVQKVDPGKPASMQVIEPDTAGTPPAVRTLYADARGGVWLGGLWASYYDGTIWKHYTQAEGMVGDEVSAVAEDAQGRIWFGTPAGLSIWTGTTFFNLTSANGLPDAKILALAADAQGVWIGSADGGLYRFEQNQLQVLTAENVGLPSNTVTALLVAANGTLFAGTDLGLAQFAEGTLEIVDAIPALPITALASSPDGSIWAGTQGAGTWVLRDGTWQPLTIAGIILPSTVRDISIDLYGGVWLGADNGLVRVAPDAR